MRYGKAVRRRALVLAVCLSALPATPARAAGGPVDPVVEAKNYAKTTERQALYDSPQGQLLLRQVSTRNGLAALQAQLSDPERNFAGDLCWNGNDGCAGDARLYDWGPKGYGLVTPVLFTARDGATLSGHVWATRAGPAQRPGVVIVNGSVQADEQMYWYAAQALAKAGYVVLTFDPQGQGQSDTPGEPPDQQEGVPAQSDGRPFFDGAEDALDFFFSTPQHPYVPAGSCTTGTSHAAKQARRAAAGLDAPYNPYWSLFDGQHVGLAGHSYGAAGVSYIGQADPRVDAIVAWDNLAQPSPGTNDGSFPPGEAGCPAHPEDRAPASIAKPALGMSADYFLPPTPNATVPDPEAKSTESRAYSAAGVDTGELIIRGGSHLDFSFISNPAFGATLRGADMIAWYTTAWFDRYVEGDPSADARLLTNRWRHDATEASVDPDHDGNMFSFYYGSRLAITLADGTKVDCETMRAGCPQLSDADGYPGEYSYLALATSPDHGDAAPVAAATSRSSADTAAVDLNGQPMTGRVRSSCSPSSAPCISRVTSS
jgi:dienelactone hydrolase